MARTNDFPRVLWLVTSAWLVGCGRIGFGAQEGDPQPPLADAPAGGVPDAASTPSDALVVIDAPVAIDAAPPIDSSIPAGTPGIAFVIPHMTTTCGAGASQVTATVSNPGTADLVVSNITLAAGEAFQVTGAFPMTIAPNASAMFVITALPAVVGTDRGGQIKSDTLVIDANATTTPVTIETTVTGANIDVTVPASAQLAFSDSSGQCPAPQPATIKNSGNATVTVALVVPAGFANAESSSAVVAAGGVMTRSIRPVTNSACSGAGTILYLVSGPSCGSSGGLSATLGATFNISGTSSCMCS